MSFKTVCRSIKTFLTHIQFVKDAAKSERPVTLAGKVHEAKLREKDRKGRKIEKEDKIMIRDIVYHFEVLLMKYKIFVSDGSRIY